MPQNKLLRIGYFFYKIFHYWPDRATFRRSNGLKFSGQLQGPKMNKTKQKNFDFLKPLKVVTTITTFENLKIQTLVVIVVTTFETFLKITQSCDHDHNF